MTGGRAFFGLLVPVSALFLPFAALMGYRVPWTYDPGQQLTWIFSGLVILIYFGVRWMRR